MSLATLVAFGIFGWVAGRLADDLVAQRRALRGANRRLRWLSDVDPLTGVLNRRAMQRRLRVEFRRAHRGDGLVALLMLDLDHFKQVNDAFGHATGDRVLRRVGRTLRRLARATDSVGRIGGEEFLVVLPATGSTEALRFAERLREAIGRDDPGIPRVTVSIGALTVQRPELRDVEQSVRLADAALYLAKSEGRDRVVLSPASYETQATARATGGSESISPVRTSC
jgi:diguanylate cyclase (GGDEF)-like protein